MKILVPGKDPKPEKLRLRCYNCGCIFEAVRSEYKLRIGQYNETEVVVKCPWCNTTLFTGTEECLKE